MAFVSYAQNFEDVILARALRDVETGFYVDVGAQDPIEDSVTKAFYDRGWSGLNLEPSEDHYARLLTERPRDVNLKVAAGDQQGSVTFYEVPETGLSTLVHEVAEGHGRGLVERKVAMSTLDAICAGYGVSKVHFLKIDVEGAEETVLKGFSFEAIRPWIVLVEATRPNSPEPDYLGWEHLITAKNYRFVYDDGLNRFYLAAEQEALADRFRVPPNVFDEFVFAREARAEARAEKNVAHHLEVIEGLGKRLEETQAHHTAIIDDLAKRLDDANGRTETERASVLHHVKLVEAADQRERSLHGEVERLHDTIGRVHESLERLNDSLVAEVERRSALEVELHFTQTRAEVLRGDLNFALAERDAVQGRLRRLRRSLSWRVTWPLRQVGNLVDGTGRLLGLRSKPTALAPPAPAPAPDAIDAGASVAADPAPAPEVTEPARWVHRRLDAPSGP